MKSNTDPHDLNRFVQAQEPIYERALAEIGRGRKDSHWMWFVFPQFDGLAKSSTAQFYAIKSGEEARAYLAHPTLGARLTECAHAAFGLAGRSAQQIFGSPDDLKFKSCLTLFETVAPPHSVFARLLEKYYQGERDERTLELLGESE